jgi:hypothetical protein
MAKLLLTGNGRRWYSEGDHISVRESLQDRGGLQPTRAKRRRSDRLAQAPRQAEI